jgi:hypothetical protein
MLCSVIPVASSQKPAILEIATVNGLHHKIEPIVDPVEVDLTKFDTWRISAELSVKVEGDFVAKERRIDICRTRDVSGARTAKGNMERACGYALLEHEAFYLHYFVRTVAEEIFGRMNAVEFHGVALLGQAARISSMHGNRAHRIRGPVNGDRHRILCSGVGIRIHGREGSRIDCDVEAEHVRCA